MAEKTMTESWLDKAFAEMEALTPETGFNVVGVDAMARAGEALYFVGNYEDKAEADRAAAEHTKSTGDTAHVYEPHDAPDEAPEKPVEK